MSILSDFIEKAAPEERINLSGLTASGTAWIFARLIASGITDSRPALIVFPDDDRAREFVSDTCFFLNAFNLHESFKKTDTLSPESAVLHLPEMETGPYEGGLISRNIIHEKMAVLDQVRRSQFRLLALSARTLSRKLPPPSISDQYGQSLEIGMRADRNEIVKQLYSMGYSRAPIVEEPGSCAVRGGIIDAWSPRHDLPVRIEIFGDEIDSLRLFDPESQRTTDPLEKTEICPVTEVIFSEENRKQAAAAIRELSGELKIPSRTARPIVEEILDAGDSFHLPDTFLPAFYENGLVPLSEWLKNIGFAAVFEPTGCDAVILESLSQNEEAYRESQKKKEISYPPTAYLLDPDTAWKSLCKLSRLDIYEIFSDEKSLYKGIDFKVRPLPIQNRCPGERASLGPFLSNLKKWRARNLLVALAASDPLRTDMLEKLLEERNISTISSRVADLHPDPSRYQTLFDVHIISGSLSSGFEDRNSGLVMISDSDILGIKPKKRRLRSKQYGSYTPDFEVSENDLVVHLEHGIGRYRGLCHLELRGFSGDFLLIEYAGKDKFYLPVQRMSQVQRYIGSEEGGLRLDRLGSRSFELRKRRIKEDLLKMAADLLNIYAARKAHPGHAFSEPDFMYREFEADFPFNETPDQEQAIRDVISDMTDPAPMDRLVCGDVGFGKTEVAMRAAMKAVMDGKQTAILVPTTVLAAQHETTFRERFCNYPINIEAISRLRTDTEKILERAAEGKIDILIGTHRLLSRDLKFRDLGLLIIDEEQRFGVAQKEKIKKLRRQIDVLTMTATPIPRTLHMSLAGIRDLSIIATPPGERRAIRTFVTRFDADSIKSAILREIERGGQVFFVHNRVRSIAAMENFLKKLLPKARIITAHGSLSPKKLEKAMSNFVSGRADILLSSTIIESGLDMPAVNTIIVNRADAFGLAQLYQLRGRVGRSSEKAYCYFLVPENRPITEKAKKRLRAIKQLTDLGSGFKLAGHDMEIRGAGNLLGKEQSGQVAAIGFDLYTDLLEESVRELKGEAPRKHIDAEVNLPVDAFLPEHYVADIHQRLILYKKLAQSKTEEETRDLRSELADRYGPLPPEALNLISLRNIALSLQDIGIEAVDAGPSGLLFTIGPSFVNIAGNIQLPFSFKCTGEGKIIFPLPDKKTGLIEHVNHIIKGLSGLSSKAGSRQ